MLITNATLVTWEKENHILPSSAIYIEDGKISAIGTEQDLRARYPAVEILDAKGQLTLPGQICAHTHFYGAFARGMAVPGDSPQNFPQILQKLWWPLDQSLNEEDIRFSALVCLVDAIKHGTTTLIDHHASPTVIDGSLDIIAEAAAQSGLRTGLCYEVTDRGGTEKMRAGINENMRFVKKSRAENNPLLAGMFGLHASLTLSESTLELCRSLAPAEAGFHIHLAESIADQEDSLAKTSLRVVERLQNHGLLGPNSIAAHGVHLNQAEIALLAANQTWVTHQPRSNMNNAVGTAPVEEMLAAGIRVCLGNDGFSNAMWEEWKTAYLVHKANQKDPRAMNGFTVAEMAIYNNAALVSQLFGQEIGALRPSASADIILVDYHSPTPLSAGNLPWHILFGFRETMITTTIVHGKVLMKNRELLTLDEAEISARARQLSRKTWERYQALF